VNDSHKHSPEEPINQGPAEHFTEQVSSEDPFQSISSTDKLQAALHYTSAGIKIFPCEPGSKRPHPWTHGFKDATTDIRPIDHPKRKDLGWFDFLLPDGSELTVTPRDNWAFEPGQAGFTVVDIDPKNGGDETWDALIAEHGPITTREVHTPSGGRHLYFHGTISAVNKKLGPGIDTRCLGGYVLLPPSSVKGRRYEWADETVPIAPLSKWTREILEAQDARTDDLDSDTAFEEWQEAGGEGGRFEYLLSRIGDEASGGEGFYDPMLTAAGYGVRIGMVLDEVIKRIEETALAASRGNRTLGYIKDKIFGLRQAVRKFRRQDQAKDADVADAIREEGTAEGTAPFAEAKAEETAGEETAPSRDWLTKEDAALRVDQQIDTWIERAGTHLSELTRKLIVPAAPAGFGKTRRVLRKWVRLVGRGAYDGENILDEDLSALPESSPCKIAVAVPTHNLGIEFQQRVIPEVEEETDATIEMPRLIGRNPDTCGRFAVVKAAVEKGHQPNHCCRRVLPDGTEQLCPQFVTCSATPGQYRHELDRVHATPNSIITHKHLSLSWMPELAFDRRKSQWIDEDPTSTFLVGHDGREVATVKDIRDLVMDRDFAELERRREEADGKSIGTSHKGLTRLAAIGAVLMHLNATQAAPKLEDFAAWSPEELRQAARDRATLERWRRGKIDPALPDAELTEQLTKSAAPKKLADLFNRLADEKAARSTGPIYSFEWRDDNLEMRGRLSTDSLPPNLLLTDATASPFILGAVFPNYEIEFQRLNIHRNAYVTQVRDLTFSRYWLLTKRKLPQVVARLKELAARYPRLAIFTTKRIRCEITGEDRKGRLPEFALMPGTTARIGHYGNLRGSDQFKDCDAIVILGREQPNVADVEDAMKALFYDTTLPLKFVKAIRTTRAGVAERDYKTAYRPYRMRDGSVQKAEVQVHPDPRGQALLERGRESEMIQALDRARLIHHEGPPKPVFILCSIPLPGVEVDRLVTWKELVGPEWLHRCVDAVAAGGKNALPLSAAWLATRFPEEFRSPKAAERALANGRVVETLGNNPQSSNIRDYERDGGYSPDPLPWFPGWHLALFRLAKTPGRPSHALVRDGVDQAAAIAEALGLEPAEIVNVADPPATATTFDPAAAATEQPSPPAVHSSALET
jgi:hypothetical protein